MKRRNLLLLFIVFTLIFVQPMVVQAAVAITSVELKFKNPGDETVYVTVVATEGENWTERYAAPIPEEVKKAFQDYLGLTALPDVEEISSKKADVTFHHIPDKYKVVLYIPGENKLLESPVYTRAKFEESYTVNINKQDGKLELKRKAWALDWIAKGALRLIVVIVIAVAIAFPFKIRGKKSIAVLAGTNLLTQLIVIGIMLRHIYLQGNSNQIIYIYYVITEVMIIVQAIIYAFTLRKTNDFDFPVSVPKAVVYAIVANVAFLLVEWIPYFVMLICQRETSP